MPNAGLLELVAHGVQDAYLIGNPQISFLRKVHKRHTNFVMQSISGTFEGQQNFGQKLVCKVPRNGDLLQGVVLEIFTSINIKCISRRYNTPTKVCR